MIEAAKAAGADAVKFQTFKAEEFCGDPDQTFTYQSQGKTITESMLEMFKRYEFRRKPGRKSKRIVRRLASLFSPRRKTGAISNC